jgi:hypothetical protein
MARGWESKSVQAQIDMADAKVPGAALKTQPDPQTLELIRRRETILLSRTRVVRELNTAQNPRYRLVLNKALADLDAQLSTFATK